MPCAPYWWNFPWVQPESLSYLWTYSLPAFSWHRASERTYFCRCKAKAREKQRSPFKGGGHEHFRQGSEILKSRPHKPGRLLKKKIAFISLTHMEMMWRVGLCADLGVKNVGDGLFPKNRGLLHCGFPSSTVFKLLEIRKRKPTEKKWVVGSQWGSWSLLTESGKLIWG